MLMSSRDCRYESHHQANQSEQLEEEDKLHLLEVVQLGLVRYALICVSTINSWELNHDTDLYVLTAEYQEEWCDEERI